MSLAMAVVAQVEEAARTHGVSRVRAVRLRVGLLAGVVPEALRSSFELARMGGVLESAVLETEIVPARARCAACADEVVLGMPLDLSCPHCGRPVTELLAGRELEIAGVLVEEREESADVPHR